MPRDNPESQAAVNEHKQRKAKKFHVPVERQIAEDGRELARTLDTSMSEEVLMKRQCEKRGRSVLVVQREKERVLKSRGFRP